MSQRYDQTGRPLMAMLWEAIANKPQRIQEIAALVDPNALRYVGWDNAANSLTFLEFAASDIPYDNSGSGLASKDVQAALDEITAALGGTGGDKVLGGLINADATVVNVPSGWVVNHLGTGQYQIIHGVGHQNWSFVTSWRENPGRADMWETFRGNNSITYQFFSLTDGSFRDLDHQFIFSDFS